MYYSIRCLLIYFSFQFSVIAVLATIENDVQNVSIVEGESANFTCNFSKENMSDIDIDWTVDGDQYDVCGTTEGDTGNGCYTTEGTQSVLLIRDTSSFSAGNHPVQCILQQSIPEDFKNDPSFKEHFNNMTSSAFLLISELKYIYPWAEAQFYLHA